MIFQSNRFRRLAAPVATRIRQSPTLAAMARGIMRALGGSAPTWELGSDTVDPRFRVDYRRLLPEGFAGKICLITRSGHQLIPSYYRALEVLGLEGRVLDPASDDFYRDLSQGDDRILLYRPTNTTNLERQMFWEKARPLYDNPRWDVYPGERELRIYESKREVFYLLEANNVPHPETHVFFNAHEALRYARECQLPQVFKTNTGSSAVGVEILRDRGKLLTLVSDMFQRHYVKRSLADARDIDYGYVMLQQFISPVSEFRVIKIGESWFGHEKKPGDTELMSGSGVVAWTTPPVALLDFCRGIAERLGFHIMAFDVFQSGDGPYLVNELQTWFGSYNNSQMYIDGVPGRFVYRDGEFHFEAGFFNQFKSMPLIIAAAVTDSVTRGNSQADDGRNVTR